jgi:histidyl-tRNA synthetase
LYTNPLRILDTKNPAMQALAAAAPRITEYLGAESRAHFERLQELLAAGGVEFSINPRLVRGLDYYNLTVYEWITDRLGAQGTICGGGRYDPLMEMLGGKPAPGCGFAIGVERVIELLKGSGATGVQAACDVYLLHQGGGTYLAALRAAETIRDAGLDVILHAGDGSLKSQMKKADASGAEYAVIVGEAEAAEGKAMVKALRAAEVSAPFALQRAVPLPELGEALAEALAAGDGSTSREN